MLTVGRSLDSILDEFGSFEENVICDYAKQITHGVVFLHNNGITHKDLKGNSETSPDK